MFSAYRRRSARQALSTGSINAQRALDASTIALLINADLLVAGIITMIQGAGVGRVLGARMPVMAGAAFTAVTPMILIAGNYGLQAVYGSMLAAGVFGMLVESRSRSRKRSESIRHPNVMARFLACCVGHSALGWAVTPAR